jgi:GntR family transcriptional regulator, rspAB operon transcriptional repressor
MSERDLLQDRAYAEIKGLVQDGTFAAGSFLSERQLAVRLRMSKTPVKNALVRLEIEGFVAVSPQQGIVVREISVGEIGDILDIRVALETYVVRRLAGRLTAAQTEKLRSNLKAQEAAVKAGDMAELTRVDADFHVLLCSFAGNAEIAQVMSRLRDKLHRIILHIMRQAAGRPAAAVAEHAAIVDAVVKGRGDRAAKLMEKHLEYGKRFLLPR